MTLWLERLLLGLGEELVRVSPKLTVSERRAGRVRGKSDPIDALAVARAALREPDLPRPQPDEHVHREIELLVDHRERLVDERRRTQPAENRDAGDLIAAVTGDAARVKSGVKTILIGASRNGAFFVGVTIIVSLIEPLIGLVFLAGGIATIIVGALGAWRCSRIASRSRRREGTFTDDLHRYFAGTAEPPLPGGDPEKRPDSKVTRVEGITTFAIHAVLAASTCAILILAVDAGRSGRLSPGSVFTILAYILLMHNKTVGFGRRIIRGGRLLSSAERVASLLAPNEKLPPQHQQIDHPSETTNCPFERAVDETFGRKPW